MKVQIEQELRSLRGMPLWDSGRAGLQWFCLGAKRMVSDIRRGKTVGTKEVGEYSLHVQCAWRIVGPEGIVVASGDQFYPPGDPHNEPPDFDWDKPGASRCAHLIAAFFEEHAENPLVVEEVWADNVGSIRLTLSRGHLLEVFPNHSFETEHWRLFKPGSDEPHFVVSRSGIEEH